MQGLQRKEGSKYSTLVGKGKVLYFSDELFRGQTTPFDQTPLEIDTSEPLLEFLTPHPRSLYFLLFTGELLALRSKMISAQKLVEEMLRPLEEVYGPIYAQVEDSPTYADVEKACDRRGWVYDGEVHMLERVRSEGKPFILHRAQWNCLAGAYSRIVGEIRSQLLRMLEPVMATLHALFSAMKSAEKSFQECVAPHVGFSNAGFHWIVDHALPDSFLLQQEILSQLTGAGHLVGFGRSKVREKLRLWMANDALRHILDREVPHRHMDDLLTASAAVYEALLHVNYLNLLGDALQGKDWPPIYSYRHDASPSNGIPVIYARYMNSHMDLEPFIRFGDSIEDRKSAIRFFSSSVTRTTDPRISWTILERLGGDGNMFEGGPICIDAKPAAVIKSLEVNPTQFRMTGRKLGNGISGTVKLWNWISEEHQVAVKEGTIGSAEIEIQARVRHPNLLPLLCCTWKEEEEKDEKSLLPVMERMDSNLHNLIDNASRPQLQDEGPPFPLPVSVEIMLQIAKGMECLHSQDIMHRDLKPANVLVSGYSTSDHSLQLADLLRVKVADFGASKENFRTSDPANSYRVGTGFYRAPEVMYGESSAGYSRKADVYSFAMVCYRILTGKEPFHDCNSLPLPRDLYERIRKGELRPKFDFRSEHSMALMGMVQQCWSAKASERPDFAQIVGFLRFIKICILQSMISPGFLWRPDLVELLKSVDLFSTFCQGGSDIEEMLRICTARKIKAFTFKDRSSIYDLLGKIVARK